MNLLLNIIGYILLFLLIELFLYVFCIFLTIKEENHIDFNTLIEDFKSYNGSASVNNKFKSIKHDIYINLCNFSNFWYFNIFYYKKLKNS